MPSQGLPVAPASTIHDRSLLLACSCLCSAFCCCCVRLCSIGLRRRRRLILRSKQRLQAEEIAASGAPSSFLGKKSVRRKVISLSFESSVWTAIRLPVNTLADDCSLPFLSTALKAWLFVVPVLCAVFARAGSSFACVFYRSHIRSSESSIHASSP